MLHTVLIAVHALCALTSLLVGGWLIYKLPQGGDERFQVYLGALVLMLIFMVAAIVTGWSQIASTTTQAIFTGLAVLGLYMAVRGFQARQALQHQGAGWQERFIDHVGFTLISLFDGFVIVSVFDLHSPPWLIAIIAVAGVVVGITLINSVKHRLA